MELEHLAFSQDIITLTGYALNIEKNSLLQSSLTVLLNDNHFDKVYFWGRIFGLDCDYYVAFGYKKDILRHSVYYYSKNAVDWVMLPTPNKDDFFLCSINSTRFIGDPSLLTTVVDDQPTEEEIHGEKQTLKIKERNLYWRKLPTYSLKEEDRLSATIEVINQEALAVPRGALYKQPNGSVVPNEAWYGMSYDESRFLGNYFHYRRPKEKWDANVAKRPDYNYAYDFLDRVDDDIPINFAWSCQTVNANRTACLRNLHWPGAVSYNILESHTYGFLYFGIAKRNLDIPFMI